MTDINSIFKFISLPDREHLMTGFNCDFVDTFVEWIPGRFIGTNITRPDLKIEQRSGFWVEGEITSHLIPFVPFAFRPFNEEVG